MHAITKLTLSLNGLKSESASVQMLIMHHITGPFEADQRDCRAQGDSSRLGGGHSIDSYSRDQSDEGAQGGHFLHFFSAVKRGYTSAMPCELTLSLPSRLS